MENHKVSLAVMLNLANIIYLFFILISIWFTSFVCIDIRDKYKHFKPTNILKLVSPDITDRIS